MLDILQPASSTSGECYEGSDLEALSTMRRYQEWIISRFRPYLAGRAIEIGAGIGNIATHILPHVDSLDLVEPSDNLIGQLQSKFAGMKNVTVIHRNFESAVAQTASEFYDCIILVNVLEHIEDDAQALAECRRVLRPSGRLLILVPALRFLYSDLDALVGHFRRYTRDTLSAVLTAAGFKIELHNYFDCIGILPWWLLNTLGGATTFNPTLVKIYDSLFVPVTRLLESRIAPPIGKNLVAVARREAMAP